ncbi:hypothetical protein PISL3812_09088 [Talaromyces islandicus]|uniref:Uncharacterized protein n=1 Tax=Talaromyces islandicus TaxID=28573 RepID=A0A0U1M8R1_TALIS|nr:hypothetical protein PISL3812_09088 [Talaromyces islandicus]
MSNGNGNVPVTNGDQSSESEDYQRQRSDSMIAEHGSIGGDDRDEADSEPEQTPEPGSPVIDDQDLVGVGSQFDCCCSTLVPANWECVVRAVLCKDNWIESAN